MRGQDADQFLIKLCQGLKAFPPQVLTRPYSHLQEMIREIIPYPIQGEEDILSTLERTLDEPIAEFEDYKSKSIEGTSRLISNSELLEMILSSQKKADADLLTALRYSK